MQHMQWAAFEIARMVHEERMQEAERFRRAREARSNVRRRTAAPRERRFSFFRFPFIRPSEA